MKSPKILVLFLIFVLFVGGFFVVLTMRNNFVVENTAAAPHEAIVYLTAEDLNTNPEELVAPEIETTFIKISANEVGYLNVRKGPGVSNAKITQVKPGEEFEYTQVDNNWYHIVIEEGKTGWVSGNYVQEIEG
jgi:uncharacterized protein YgiM (DUF1202 family)